VEIDEHLSVGRSDPDDGYMPGLDLSGYGGQDAGVSRRHAVIDVKDGGLQVQDLGSTNGTRVNGFDLAANQPYKLKQGDEIEFGHLRMLLHLVNPPG
jgi:pSer/pThr/pTyr-binding forkhead associated (FHA) protein